jgi:hypothetical protein
MVRRSGPQYAQHVRAFALMELGDSESIDLFLREEDARRALEDILSDEPDWAGLFYLERVETRRARRVGELNIEEPEPTGPSPQRGGSAPSNRPGLAQRDAGPTHVLALRLGAQGATPTAHAAVGRPGESKRSAEFTLGARSFASKVATPRAVRVERMRHGIRTPGSPPLKRLLRHEARAA